MSNDLITNVEAAVSWVAGRRSLPRDGTLRGSPEPAHAETHWQVERAALASVVEAIDARLRSGAFGGACIRQGRHGDQIIVLVSDCIDGSDAAIALHFCEREGHVFLDFSWRRVKAPGPDSESPVEQLLRLEAEGRLIRRHHLTGERLAAVVRSAADEWLGTLQQ